MLHECSCTSLPVLDYSDACFREELRRSSPINQVRVSNLNPASKEMISDSVELCETEVCFLHIQLIGTNVWLPKMHNVPPEVDFESSRSPAKIGVLKQSQSALFCSVPHMTILFVFTCVMNVRYQSIQAFVMSSGSMN